MKIYTKAGDQGDTGLLGGDRISKASRRIEAIGEVDELNASLGIVATTCNSEEFTQKIQWIQNRLFDFGSELACPPSGKFQLEVIHPCHVERLESEIDTFETELAPLKNFILPGGCVSSSHMHLSRAICRRSERSLLRLAEEESVRPVMFEFLNRLSDWMFCASRVLNSRSGIADIIWVKDSLGQA